MGWDIVGEETSLRWNQVLSSADIKTYTFTMSNTGTGGSVGIEIVVNQRLVRFI